MKPAPPKKEKQLSITNLLTLKEAEVLGGRKARTPQQRRHKRLETPLFLQRGQLLPHEGSLTLRND